MMNPITGKVEITVEEFERLREIERNISKIMFITCVDKDYRGSVYYPPKIGFENETEAIKHMIEYWKNKIDSTNEKCIQIHERDAEEIKKLTSIIEGAKNEFIFMEKDIKPKSIFFWRNK